MQQFSEQCAGFGDAVLAEFGGHFGLESGAVAAGGIDRGLAVVELSRPGADLLSDFVRIAHRIVWCTLATVDERNRPRSRVVHPYWERGPDGVTGWAFTRLASPKVAHLTHCPYVSCSYWDAVHEIAVAECDGEIADDEPTRRRVWDLFASAAEPLGYDPRILGGDDHRDESITVIRMTPWRLMTPSGSWRRGRDAQLNEPTT